jgi:riboflavin kinase/FMN adenylyltransferase
MNVDRIASLADVDGSSISGQFVATIGAFDGVHRGHQFLISEMVKRAQSMQCQSLVVTFDPLPIEVLRPQTPPGRLTEIEERIRLISGLGVDRVCVLAFTHELSRLPAREFVERLLDRYRIREFWSGADFAFGHNREGNVAFLTDLGAVLGFSVHAIERKDFDGMQLASSTIRGLVADGSTREASVLLGHFPSVTGVVVHGAARGHDLGFPTANLEVAPHTLVPKTGIYAGYARLSDERHAAAISVGYNPTFGANPLSVEAYLLDYDGELFGTRVTLEFVERLRDEKYFDKVNELIDQMTVDVATVREVIVPVGVAHPDAAETTESHDVDNSASVRG